MALAQNLTPEGFALPSPLTGNEIVDCAVFDSPYITTCTTGQIGALAGPALTLLINNSGAAALPGAAVYVNGAGRFGLAIASAYSTGGVLALANRSIANGAPGPVTTAGPVTLTTGQWDAVTGGSGGLASGLLYFLDPSTPGKLSTTAPSTPGQVVTLVGRAISPTVMIVAIQPPIQL